jgi:phasin family protein
MTTHTKKNAVDFNPFRELTKTFEQFKVSSVGSASFVEARRKDVEAMVAANKVTYDALLALARTQTDMLTQAMQSMQDSAKGGLARSEKGGDMARQTEAAQTAWQKMLADMKALAEMVQKAQAEAMTGLTERAKENMGALKGLAHAK